MTDDKDKTSRLNAETNRAFERSRYLWFARARHSRITGIAYLVLSIVFIILSYLIRYLLLEVIAIVSLMLGVALLFVSLEKYVKQTILEGTAASLLLPLAEFVDVLGLKGKAVYIPRGSDVLAFIPKDEQNPQNADYKEVKKTGLFNQGLALTPVGTYLRKLYEDELGTTASNIDVSDLAAWLPRIFVDDLKMAEKMEIVTKDDEVQVRFNDPIFGDACNRQEIAPICERIGCAVCSSIGELWAKSTKRIVLFGGCKHLLGSDEVTLHFTLGQMLETVKTREQQ